MKRLALVFGACLFATLVAAQSEKQTVERPDVKVGDAWTYVTMDLLTKIPQRESTLEITEVGEATITGKVRSDGKESVARYGPDWSGASDFPIFSFPLEIGKKWKYRRSYMGSCGDAVDEMEAEVKGWEDIEVPAGKFRALRVEHNGTFNAPRCGYGKKHHWCWYVPSVKRFVRYEQGVYGSPAPAGFIQDLASFKLK